LNGGRICVRQISCAPLGHANYHEWFTILPSAEHASARGHVTRFRVTKAFLDYYEVQRVGGKARREYWIPAEDLAGFNAALVGEIEVVAEFTAHGSF